jgi:YD repeat-containing protein
VPIPAPGGRGMRSAAAAILCASLLHPPAAGDFIRGDSSGDFEVDLSDVLFSLNYTFLAGRLPGCLDAADVNDDGRVDVSDAVFTLFYLFAAGEPPRAPGLQCGPDPTADDPLGCDSYPHCSVIESDYDRLAREAGPGHPWQGRLAGVNPYSLGKQTEIGCVSWRSRGGMRLGFTLHHSSVAAAENPALGAKWLHSFDTTLEMWIDSTGLERATVGWGDHTLQGFKKEGDGWTPVDGYRDRLDSSGPSPALTLKSRERLDFEARPGVTNRFRLARIVDPNGNQVTLTYDEAGRLQEVMDPTGRSLELGYSAAGRLEEVRFEVEGWSRTWKLAFGATGLLAEVRWPEVTTDGGLQSQGVKLSYDPNRNIASFTDRRGGRWQYGYDVDRVAWEQAPTSTALERTLFQDLGGGVRSVQDPRGFSTTFSFDDSARLVRVTDELSNSRKYQYADADYGWAPSSLVLPSNAVWASDHDSRGNVVSVTDPEGRRFDFAFDPSDRLLQVQEPMVTNAFGQSDRHRTNYEYDPRGNLTRVTKSAGFISSTLATYAYDLDGELVRETDGRDKVTTYSHDLHGNFTQVSTAAGRTTGWRYEDPDGTFGFTCPSSLVDGLGRAIQTSRDQWGRLREVDQPDASPSTYSYDGEGRLVRMVDAAGTSVWEYDGSGRMKSETTGPDWVVNYQYGPGQPVTRLDEVGPSGVRSLEYEYTPRNELASISDQRPGAGTISFAYDPDGRLIRRSLPSGARVEYGYNASGRLASVAHITSQGVTYASYTYLYQENGLRKQVADLDGTTRYGYDSLNRLTREQRTGTFAYQFLWAYDGASNRQSQDRDGISSQYTYDDDNRLLSIAGGSGARTWAWDPNGRLATWSSLSGIDHFNYDSIGRLLSINHEAPPNPPLPPPPPVIIEYRYDGLNRRRVRINEEEVTRYDHDLLAVAREETAGPGSNRFLQHTWGRGLIRSEEAGSPDSEWCSTDGLGTLRGWTGDGGGPGPYSSVLNAFGEVVHEEGARPPYAFGADAGLRSEGAAGLLYLERSGSPGADWYDPETALHLPAWPGQLLIQDQDGGNSTTRNCSPRRGWLWRIFHPGESPQGQGGKKPAPDGEPFHRSAQDADDGKLDISDPIPQLPYGWYPPPPLPPKPDPDPDPDQQEKFRKKGFRWWRTPRGA